MADEQDPSHDSTLQDHGYKASSASAVALIAVGTVVFSILEDWSIGSCLDTRFKRHSAKRVSSRSKP